MAPIAASIVSLSSDGKAVIHHNTKELLDDGSLSTLFYAYQADKKEEEHKETEVDDTEIKTKEDGKLVSEEEISLGDVEWPACKQKVTFLKSLADVVPDALLVNAMGGQWPKLFWTICLLGFIINQIADTMQMWWLGW